MIKEHEIKKLALSTKLKQYINLVEQKPAEYVMERTACERLVKMMPTRVNLGAINGVPYLIRDYFSKWSSFTNILYCSLDYQNVILFILFFSLFDRLTGNSIISLAIIYLIEKMLKYCRHYLSERNLSRKTLIDERFLIWVNFLR